MSNTPTKLTQQEICTQYRERQAAEKKDCQRATLRAAAREAGEVTFVVPRCGGGFTDHHISTETGRCVECKTRQNTAHLKTRKATVQQEAIEAPVDAGGHL
jgi:hypothetical protein